MFKKGEIWAYPTDTSFGLGVRIDDLEGLINLKNLKQRQVGKFYSIMVRDFSMLQEFAKIPENLNEQFFFEKPRTVILEPTEQLPQSKFWPVKKVAFRIATIKEIAESIEFPITATSANVSGDKPIFEIKSLKTNLNQGQKKYNLKICNLIKNLPQKKPSEIWDFTVNPIIRIR
jgi:L-threonylcarbamoyladenylate synthase